MNRYILSLLFIVTLSGCDVSTSINQKDLCIYSSDQDAKECKAGQLSYFRPQSWGSEQLPLQVAAIYCDFNHQIMQTNAGVVCIFTDKRLHLLK